MVLIRYLFGFRGDALTVGAIGEGASEVYLAYCSSIILLATRSIPTAINASPSTAAILECVCPYTADSEKL